MLRRRPIPILLVMLLGCPAAAEESEMRDYPVRPVPFTDVQITAGLWADRIETNRSVTIPYDFAKCAETGRIDNFARAGGLMPGPHKGLRYDDSDVFKVIEGASYALAVRRDEKLEAYLDDLIAKIAAAQEPDGYLFTIRTIDPRNVPDNAGKERWSHLRDSHELYNAGHLYEAAVAHHLATGKRTLVDVALKNADLVAREFGPDARRDVPGHQEIEIGLVKLYRITGNDKYLKLARFFLDERGRADGGRQLGGQYNQDHQPVVEQTEVVGHAVRAVYMYSAMADVAALTGDQAYLKALDALWHDIVDRKMYLTGGIGARHDGERFGDAYELPNRTAYCETCAAVASAMWNHRMFLLHGDAKYLDVLERVIYNGFLSGASLSGDRFFYPNPLASDGSVQRKEWFGTSCCPVNVARFVPSVAGYVYATRGADQAYVNLFMNGSATLKLGDARTVRLSQETAYPWDGKVTLRIDAVEPDAPAEFTLNVRIPGWAQGKPVPGNLYAYLNDEPADVKLRVNGEALTPEVAHGFARIERAWVAGDTVELELPMEIRRVVSNEKVDANRGRVALERGPIVYALEAADNAGRVSNLAIPDSGTLKARREPELLGGVVVISGPAVAKVRNDEGEVEIVQAEFRAIPYYAWAHRDAGEMAVWVPRDVSDATAPPKPTLASAARVTASHVFAHDSTAAVNDQIEPESSAGASIPRFTWWPRQGTSEWLQYEFPQPAEASRVRVYWFDDTGTGKCRPPASWRLLYRDADTWKPVNGAESFGTAKDAYNEVSFDKVTTAALRLEAQLQDGYSAGVLEWHVE